MDQDHQQQQSTRDLLQHTHLDPNTKLMVFLDYQSLLDQPRYKDIRQNYVQGRNKAARALPSHDTRIFKKVHRQTSLVLSPIHRQDAQQSLLMRDRQRNCLENFLFQEKHQQFQEEEQKMLEQEKAKYVQYLVGQFGHMLPQELRQGGVDNYLKYQAEHKQYQKNQSKHVLHSIFQAQGGGQAVQEKKKERKKREEQVAKEEQEGEGKEEDQKEELESNPDVYFQEFEDNDGAEQESEEGSHDYDYD